MNTDLKMVKEKSKALFDAVSFADAKNCVGELGDIIIAHPFTNSPFVLNPKTKQLCNILIDKQAAKDYREGIFQLIDKSEDINHILLLLNKPYLLCWFKFVNYYLSPKDYAEALKYCWMISENPNMDANVNVSESLRFFKKADKRLIMNDEEKTVFDSIPDEVTLYRGVAKGREPFGLSYTLDLNKATWFKNRFNHLENVGYLITLHVKKEDCICYINERDEQEIVLDIDNYKDEIRKQIPC